MVEGPQLGGPGEKRPPGPSGGGNHWWERQEDERYRLDWGDLVGEALELLLDIIDAIT